MPETDCGPRATIAAARSCPMCGYALVGLPETHRCPECGFLFDPHARVIELGAKIRLHQSFGYGAALLLVVVFSGANEWEVGDYVFLAFAAGAMFIGFVRMTSGDYLQRLVLNAEGMQFIRGEHCRTIIDWRHVGRAKCSLLFGKLGIRDRNNQFVYRCSLYELGGWRTGRRCERAINEALEVYSGG